MIDFTKMEKVAPVVIGQNLIAVKKSITEKYMPLIESLKNKATEQEVEDDSQEKEAITKIGQVKTLVSDLELHRKEVILKEDRFVRGINKSIKPFRDELNEIETILKSKTSDYGWKKELERRKKEEAERKAAAELQGKINKEAEKAKVIPPPAPTPVLPAKPVVRTESGTSSHLRMEWKMTEMVDFAIVPDEYKILDERKVKMSIRAGVRNIEGLKIEEVPTTIIRR